MSSGIEGQYRLWKLEAERRGWGVPINDAIPKEAWIRYWRAMEEYERKRTAGDPDPGRPVIPHRTGRGS